MSAVQISIANDFSPFPGGRYRRLGPHSGEAFREDVLLPLLKQHDQVTVDLDGVRGTPSSFFDEAFGGLVRVHHYSPSDLRVRLKLVSLDDMSQIDEIWGYISQSATKV